MAEWRPVVGWEDYYMVSDEGEVLSLPRRVVCNGGYRMTEKRILRPGIVGNGALFVNLSVDREKRVVMICRLVAEAFLGSIPDHCRVIHLDGDCTNNHLTNLKIGTNAEAMHHARPDRFSRPADPEIIRQARQRLAAGVGVKETSRDLGLPYSLVWKLANNDCCYKWLKEVD